MKIKVSDYIAQFLHHHKITHVFEVAGGMIAHILDALHLDGRMDIISVHHEQAAAFAADAYGRITGKPGIAMATSGPGATNLLTGIAGCYFDSSPAIFITGQVNLQEQKGTLKIRQLGFQETDIVAMAKPVTKKCYSVKEARHIPMIFHEAYQIAISGRKGPVLIDIPMNIQREIIDVDPLFKNITEENTKLNENNLDALHEAIAIAEKPLILAGGGINSGRASKEFLAFAELIQVPIVTSLQALDVLPFDHPLRVGFIGTYGNRWANLAMNSADLLIVMGSRLDIRQTGADLISFCNKKKIFHIDCDENEINNRVKGCIPIHGTILDFLKAMTCKMQPLHLKKHDKWLHEIASIKKAWPDISELKQINGINPNVFIHMLSKSSMNALGFVADVGSHQMWAAQSLEIRPHQIFISSAGLGSMGFALPAAIGISLASQRKPVVVIAGDGGFQMNIQELQTVVRNKLPIKIVIINNNCLGMIRQFQDSYFHGRYQSTSLGYSAPNFEEIGRAYGILSHTISGSEEIASGLRHLWKNTEDAALLQVMVEANVNVYPKIAFGKAIDQMEPFAMAHQ